MDTLTRNEKIDQIIKKIIKKKHTELSIGIIYNDNIKVYEYGNITDKPYYDIGSLSKIFTSLLILKAVHQGLINLDDEIDKYLDLKEQKYPTISELLRHNTGYLYLTPWKITVPRLIGGYSRKNIYRKIDEKIIIKYLEKIGYRNNNYGYSDFAYAILYLIIEKTYQKSYQEVLDEMLINDFNIDDIKVINERIERKDCYLHNKKINNWQWEINNPYIASGGITSSIKGIVNFINQLINSDKEYIRDSFTILDSDDKHNNAFFLSKNKHVYYHVGGIGRFRSNLSINKKKKIGIIILCNDSSYHMGSLSNLSKIIYNNLRRKKIEL